MQENNAPALEYRSLYNMLAARADPLRAEKMAAYMKNQFKYSGIDKATLDKLLKPLLKAAQHQAVDWAFIRACWQAGEREMQYAALAYLKHMQNCLDADDIPALHQLIT